MLRTHVHLSAGIDEPLLLRRDTGLLLDFHLDVFDLRIDMRKVFQVKKMYM